MKKPKPSEDAAAPGGRAPLQREAAAPADMPQPNGETAARPSPAVWEDSSGEGAASALQSLRKLEQSREQARPADERPDVE